MVLTLSEPTLRTDFSLPRRVFLRFDLEIGLFQKIQVELFHRHSMPHDVAEKLRETALPITEFRSFAQLHFVKEEYVKIS